MIEGVVVLFVINILTNKILSAFNVSIMISLYLKA